MRILLTHRYFWPDSPPYAAILRSIGDGLSAAGHEVSVFTTLPSYRGQIKAPSTEQLGSLNVRRGLAFPEKKSSTPTRIANVFLYCLGLARHIVQERPDVVTASTFPPVVAAWTASFFARRVGAQFVYHMQDIHPEVSQASEGRLGRGLPFRILRWIDNQTLKRANCIVVLSQDMANTLKARGLGDLPVTVINNFLLEKFESATEKKVTPKDDSSRMMIFAGNLGRFQNLLVLSRGIKLAMQEDQKLRLRFLGDGEMLGALKAFWSNEPRTEFIPHKSFVEACEIIEQADIAIASLRPNIYRVSYPSKILSYLGLGVPVLTLVEPESEMANIIRQNELGMVPDSSEPEVIAATIAAIAKHGFSRRAIVEWYENNVSRRRAILQWVNVFATLQGNANEKR